MLDAFMVSSCVSSLNTVGGSTINQQFLFYIMPIMHLALSCIITS